MKNEENIQELKTEIDDLKKQVEWYKQQLGLMKSRQFGVSSEKSVAIAEQLSLFNEAEATATQTEIKTEEITYKRKKQKGKREIDFSKFPKEEIIYELSEDELFCVECGESLHACGHEVLRRELTYVPAKYKVTEHIQTLYSCRHCERTNDHVPMKKSEVPDALIKGSGIASPSLVAHILNSKYTLALPLYRQEQEFKRMGVELSRQTMSNWVIYTHKMWFSRLYDELHKRLLEHEILHADETTLQVLKENGRKAKQKSYVWLYNTSGDTETPIVLYDYQQNRKGENASDFLDKFKGKLHTDGYDGYHCKLPSNITVVGCWAHLRRKFTDAIKCLPESTKGHSPAHIGLKYLDDIFELERVFKKEKLSAEQIFEKRIEKTKPIVEKFYQWVEQEQSSNPMPKTVYGVALGYAINQKEWLMNVFLDGRLELSNNRAERSIRPFAVGRKNWLFCNTPKGASASATVYSIIETAKANNLNPFLYLKFLLENLPKEKDISTCLPWNENVKLACK